MRFGALYCGEFFGQTNHGQRRLEALSVEALLSIVDALPGGVTELACHPGYATDVATAYRGEREVELRTLVDPRVRARLDECRVTLCSFAAVAPIHA